MTFPRIFIAILIAGILSFSFGNSISAQNVPIKIAVVDFKLIQKDASVHKSIREQLSKKSNADNCEIQKERDALRISNQELAQKKTLLSPEAFQEERRKFEQKLIAVQKKVREKNQYIQKSQSKALQVSHSKLRDIILKMAQDNSYTWILRKEQTVIVADKMDITQSVISALNKQLPSIKVFKGK